MLDPERGCQICLSDSQNIALSGNILLELTFIAMSTMSTCYRAWSKRSQSIINHISMVRTEKRLFKYDSPIYRIFKYKKCVR